MKTAQLLTLTHKTDFLEEFGILFRDIQMSGIFADSITFNDCIPKFPAAEILERYEVEKTAPGFDLADFFLENFNLPDFQPQKYQTDPNSTIEEHIESLWPILTREHLEETGSSLIPVPNPYVVPGGRFRGLYYWDSYFVSLGLEEHGRLDLIEGTLENFTFLIDQIGFIPNANRTYYLGRSQPPVFAMMVDLLARHKGEIIWAYYLPYLEKEYLFWMKGAESLSPENPADLRVVRLEDGTLLNRFWDNCDAPRPESYKEDVEIGRLSKRNSREVYRHIRAGAESGWDFSSRWFKHGCGMEYIHTTDILPVDLNCLILNIEKTLIKNYADNPEKSELVETLRTRAVSREKALLTRFWSESEGIFMDYDWQARSVTASLSLAGIYPMFFKIASPEQAKRCAELLEEKFLKPGGFTTTLVESGQQWDLPNGWAPLQWIVFKGLHNYGYLTLAKEGASRWINVNRIVFRKTGKLTEKYNILNRLEDAQGGEYPNQDGFGWTNGVYLKLSRWLENPL